MVQDASRLDGKEVDEGTEHKHTQNANIMD